MDSQLVKFVGYVVETENENNVLSKVAVRHAESDDIRRGVFWYGYDNLCKHLDYVLTTSPNLEVDVLTENLTALESDGINGFVARLRFNQD